MPISKVDGVIVYDLGVDRDLAVTSGLIDDPDVTYGSISICPTDRIEKIKSDAPECWFDTDVGVHSRIIFRHTDQVRDMISHLSSLLTTMLLDENTALTPETRDGKPFVSIGGE